MYPNLAMPPYTALQFVEWEANQSSGAGNVLKRKVLKGHQAQYDEDL